MAEEVLLTNLGEMRATAKVLAVISELSAGRSGLSTIADATGLPISTTHRILGQLVGAGWAQREEGRRYRPGPELRRLALRVGSSVGRQDRIGRRSEVRRG